MSRILPALLVVAFTVYCVVDVVQSDERSRRGVPAWLWVLLVVLVPVLGGLAWIVSSRSARAGDGGPGGGGGSRPRRPGGRPGGGRGPVAPDDDPDFLRRLDEQRRRRQAAEGREGTTSSGDEDGRGQGTTNDGPVTQG
ncbi:PLDc N-terminal domain-containing protein [Cellulomonas marina]|uniref:Phospholipase_D-nuclease N-terminal n=1 Tax=Cellulomonas marina TaxID=988821 RepID=A0A1I0XIP8_9CELL|nr:PLDc N-terminal domain-containing protein [Cellulomonas marina]GIG30081.1 hypothetical protein Cma02nite_26810 [Cellulomonas marina]SFB00882.1 Phospholipase_D-nuclease N-terminal [Cellulomonas marina]